MLLRLQAHSSDKIYFVPIDYVQQTISDLFFIPASNKTFHITGKHPGSTKDIQKVVGDALQIGGLIVEAKVLSPTFKEKLFGKFLSDLMPYFSTEITFDTTNVEEALGEDRLKWVVDYDALSIIIVEYFNNMFPEIIPNKEK